MRLGVVRGEAVLDGAGDLLVVLGQGLRLEDGGDREHALLLGRVADVEGLELGEGGPDQGVEHLPGGGVDGEAVLPGVEPALERARLPGDAVAGRVLGGGLELLAGQPRGLGDGVQHLGESPPALHEHVVHGPVRGTLEHREGLGRGHPLAQHEVPRTDETAARVPGGALESTG